MALIANARMYAVSPGAKAAWEALFAWVAERAGVPLAFVDHAFPAPLADLWARPDLGCAFMCGWPFARHSPRPKLLAAPVPAPARYGGRPIYFTDFVVRADSPFRSLADTFGHRLAYTVEDSHSGFNAVRRHLLGHGAADTRRLYGDVIGPCVTPRRVIEAVLEGRADVGPLDSYVHDLLRRHEPGLVGRLRVVAVTAPAPIPPLVAGADCPDAAAMRLRAALLDIGAEPGLAPLREALCLSGFAATAPEAYEVTLAWAREAAAAGYERLA